MTKETEPYTFDDIEPYTYVVLRGRPGWVLDKGDHVVDTVENAEHVYIEFADDNDNGDDSSIRLHERFVNKYLKNRETLWVDWECLMYHSTQGERQINAIH